jgi:hypothetical protein
MRILIGAAVAALLLASPALAQEAAPSACAGFAAAPTLPDGATANAAAITTGDATFRTWHTAGAEKLVQCRAEVEAARARVRDLEALHNTAADQLNGTRDAWQVEVNEYNARGNTGESRRERGGVRTGGATSN